jgi:hypothetical protein
MMHLPRFTAEAALYRSNAAYTTGTAGATAAGRTVVAPQVCVNSPCLRIPLIPIGVRLRCCTKWTPPFFSCSVQTC